MNYTELQITTNFSFLRGASHPEELAEHAAALGYREIAITDRNSFAGIVRAHAAAKKMVSALLLAAVLICPMASACSPTLLTFLLIRKFATCSLWETGVQKKEIVICIKLTYMPMQKISNLSYCLRQH